MKLQVNASGVEHCHKCLAEYRTRRLRLTRSVQDKLVVALLVLVLLRGGGAVGVWRTGDDRGTARLKLPVYDRTPFRSAFEERRRCRAALTQKQCKHLHRLRAMLCGGWAT